MDKHTRVSKYLTRSPRFERRRHKSFRVPSSSQTGKLVLSQKTLTVTLIVMLVLGGIFHLMLINSRVTKNFKIDELYQRLSELQKSNAQLERKAADLQSIHNIQQRLDLSYYVPTTDVSYLNEQDYALLETLNLNP